MNTPSEESAWKEDTAQIVDSAVRVMRSSTMLAKLADQAAIFRPWDIARACGGLSTACIALQAAIVTTTFESFDAQETKRQVEAALAAERSIPPPASVQQYVEAILKLGFEIGRQFQDHIDATAAFAKRWEGQVPTRLQVLALLGSYLVTSIVVSAGIAGRLLVDTVAEEDWDPVGRPE